MRNWKIWGLASVMVIVALIVLAKLETVKTLGLSLQNREVKLTVLATADLHGGIPAKLAEYIKEERMKDKNLILVDAGDFYDADNGDISSIPMRQWFQICGPNSNHQRRMPPIVRAMAKQGYDAVVLGNHEFVSNDKDSLDELILDFADCDIPVLSANLYTTLNHYNYKVNYVNPYIIKEVETDQGVVKVGILGLTIKEVGESNGPRELKDLPQYKGTLELTDILQEVNSKKWVECMEADIIIAVVHSGEESTKSKDSGNRIKELAQSTDGIDAIVAAHTHVNIPEHKYKNKSGETVIVTQPGRYGQYCSKISFTLVKNNGKWEVIDKSSSTQKTK